MARDAGVREIEELLDVIRDSGLGASAPQRFVLKGGETVDYSVRRVRPRRLAKKRDGVMVLRVEGADDRAIEIRAREDDRRIRGDVADMRAVIERAELRRRVRVAVEWHRLMRETVELLREHGRPFAVDEIEVELVLQPGFSRVVDGFVVRIDDGRGDPIALRAYQGRLSPDRAAIERILAERGIHARLRAAIAVRRERERDAERLREERIEAATSPRTAF